MPDIAWDLPTSRGLLETSYLYYSITQLVKVLPRFPSVYQICPINVNPWDAAALAQVEHLAPKNAPGDSARAD